MIPKASEFGGRLPSGESPMKKAAVIALAVVAGVASWFGMQWLLTTIDNAPSAEHGYRYVADDYSVRFPGEPHLTVEKVPGTELTVEFMQWGNRQKQYAATWQPARQEGATLESVTESAVLGGGGTAIESEDYDVEGGRGMLTQVDSDGENLWLLVAFPDVGDGVAILTFLGDERDRAFFESLSIGNAATS